MPTSTAAPQWWKYPGSDIPDAPPTPPEGKLSYNDWWNQIESKVDYGTTLGHTPAGGYMNYLAGITVNPVTSPTTVPRPANEPVNPPMSGPVGGALAVQGRPVSYNPINPSLNTNSYFYNPEDPGEIQWNYESPIIQEWQRTTQGPYTRQGLKSWMDKRGISVTPPTTSQPTVTQSTTTSTPSEPAAVTGPITPPTWLGNVPSSTAMKFSDPELSLRPLQAGGSPQLFPSFQMPSFNYPASNPRQGSKNWWEMDWG